MNVIKIYIWLVYLKCLFGNKKPYFLLTIYLHHVGYIKSNCCYFLFLTLISVYSPVHSKQFLLRSIKRKNIKITTITTYITKFLIKCIQCSNFKQNAFEMKWYWMRRCAVAMTMLETITETHTYIEKEKNPE